MLELRQSFSEDDYDSPVGLDEHGVVYMRRKACEQGSGYDIYHETVPYEKVRCISISPQSSKNRVLSAIGRILLGLVIMAVTLVALFNGVIIFGIIIIIAPFLVWDGIKGLMGPNGINIIIDSEGEKKYTFSLEFADWLSKQDDIIILLRDSGASIDIYQPEPNAEGRVEKSY